jgi:hypothetical protein
MPSGPISHRCAVYDSGIETGVVRWQCCLPTFWPPLAMTVRLGLKRPLLLSLYARVRTARLNMEPKPLHQPLLFAPCAHVPARRR